MKTAELNELIEGLRGLKLPQQRVYDIIKSHIDANTRILNLERMLVDSRTRNHRLTERMKKIAELAKETA